MKRTLLIASIACCMLASCIGEDTLPVIDPGLDEDTITLANAQRVREAADAFAALNSGAYPSDVNSDETPGGQTLIDLLPDGQYLTNPYTDAATEPRNGEAATPGEIGYVQVQLLGAPSSFQITAWGETEQITAIDNIAELEAASIANGYLVRDAVEAFAAENYGLYPSDTSPHQSRGGHTVIDLLPDGQMLTNPFSLAATEPLSAAAAVVSGEVGYVPVVQGGHSLGYMITVWGYHDNILTLHVYEKNAREAAVKANCYSVLKAVETFAAANAGVYPNDTSSDTTPQGDTVIDILGGLLLNPYTQATTEPVNATAVLQGETGYLPVSSESTNDGFMITGFGDTELILELIGP